MRPVYDGLRTLYPGTKQWSNRVINRAKRQRGRPYTTTLLGRRLYGDRGKEYALVDYTVQGSAAEFLKQGAVRCDAAGLGPFMRLPIHDELMFECPAEQAKDVLHVATEALTDRTNYQVPFTWSGNILPGKLGENLSTGVDPIGAVLGNMHATIGHDATAAFIGQPAGDKSACKLGQFEQGKITRDEAAWALAGNETAPAEAVARTDKGDDNGS